MTDTEMFIEAIVEKRGDQNQKTRSKRTVLFDALTEFMKKQAKFNKNDKFPLFF